MHYKEMYVIQNIMSSKIEVMVKYNSTSHETQVKHLREGVSLSLQPTLNKIPAHVYDTRLVREIEENIYRHFGV